MKSRLKIILKTANTKSRRSLFAPSKNNYFYNSMRNIGDIIKLEATGYFAPCIECIVLEISPEDGRVTKMKAVEPDERLAKLGFMLEGEDYVAAEWNYFPN